MWIFDAVVSVFNWEDDDVQLSERMDTVARDRYSTFSLKLPNFESVSW